MSGSASIMKRMAVAAAVLLLLASCGGSRKASRPAGNAPSEVYDSHRSRGMNRYGDKLVSEARRWLGTPYKYGGENRKGADCSGMTMVVYRDVAGIKIPRNSAKQQEFCTRIVKSDLAPGDLVFFSSSKRGNVTHVGMYAGAGKFIHASSSRGVIVSSLEEDYYRRHFHSAGRVPGATAKGKGPKDEPAQPVPVARPFGYERVDRLPGQPAKAPDSVVVADTVLRPMPVVVTETVRVVEVRVDTVYVPVPSTVVEPDEVPDSIADEIRRAF